MDARMHKYRITRWIGKSLFALFLTLSWEVQAAAESVAPLYSNGYTTADVATWEVACHANGCFPGGACTAYDKLMPDPYSSVGSGYLFCGAFLTANNVFTGNGIWRIFPVCPTPTINPTVLYQYETVSSMCERPAQCPVGPLPDLPTDNCSKSLEAGGGKDVNNACSSKLLPEMQKQAQCLADKIHALGLPYTEPSATVRTEAYQQHLLDVWNKLREIEQTPLSDDEKLACAAVIADVLVLRLPAACR